MRRAPLTVSLHSSPLPPPCIPLGCVAWSRCCRVAAGGEGQENSSVSDRVGMLTMLWNILLPDLRGMLIWFHSFSLVFHSLRRCPEGLSNYQSHLFCLSNFFAASVWGEVEGGQRVVSPPPVPHPVLSHIAVYISLHLGPSLHPAG